MKNNLKKIIEKNCIKNKDIIKLSETLQKINFSIIAIGDGLVSNDDFLTPCIVFCPIGMPKYRLNNEKESLKKYFDKYARKKVDEFTKNEYSDYLGYAEKAGETEEFKIWRKNSKNSISSLIEKVKKFNLINKNKIKLSVLKFSDGPLRLDFGDQKKDDIRHKYSKATLNKKNDLIQTLFLQFSLFNSFLLNN